MDLIYKYFPDLTRSQYLQYSKLQDLYIYWNSKVNLGVCADWFVGPRVEAGWISAKDLYKKINK